ncbi:hypothetical protein EPYR_01992 [Erwinia pyrifoliae DSM 12163]|nr:hypothetical protein EPYR_01992 [Erwinia pyrifoliae DSM 12163]
MEEIDHYGQDPSQAAAHPADDVAGQTISGQRRITQSVDRQWLMMQDRTRRRRQSLRSQINYVVDAGNRFQAPLVTAAAALAIRIDLNMSNLGHCVAATVKQLTGGNDTGTDVLVNH